MTLFDREALAADVFGVLSQGPAMDTASIAAATHLRPLAVRQALHLLEARRLIEHGETEDVWLAAADRDGDRYRGTFDARARRRQDDDLG